LSASIDALIRENRDLKRQLARLEAGSSNTTGASSRQLTTLQRRVSQALEQPRSRVTAARQRRRITDPAVLATRRAALAKAREARAAKRSGQ
jgi:hypothetical protein